MLLEASTLFKAWNAKKSEESVKINQEKNKLFDCLIHSDHTYNFEKSCKPRYFSIFATFGDPKVINLDSTLRSSFAPQILWEVHCRVSRVPSRVSWLEPEPPLMGSKVPPELGSRDEFRHFFEMKIEIDENRDIFDIFYKLQEIQ